MVHCHSSAVREARRARAFMRGYIRPLAPGARLLEVPAPLHGQLKTMAGSLARRTTAPQEPSTTLRAWPRSLPSSAAPLTGRTFSMPPLYI
eukprot:11675281-Alexandrium_andersonii.AAC.1